MNKEGMMELDGEIASLKRELALRTYELESLSASILDGVASMKRVENRLAKGVWANVEYKNNDTRQIALNESLESDTQYRNAFNDVQALREKKGELEYNIANLKIDLWKKVETLSIEKLSTFGFHPEANF